MQKNNAAAQYIEALASKAGLAFASSFLKSGHFIVVATEQDLPLILRQSIASPVCSIYDSSERITWFVAENIPASAVYGNMLREIGIHFGLQLMLGKKKTEEVVADARYLFITGNPAMQSAWGRVPTSSKRQMPAASSEEIQEAIGYLVEDPRNHNLGLAKKIFSSIKVFLFKKNFPVGRLSEADLTVLAVAAAREAVQARRTANVSSRSVADEGRKNYPDQDRRKNTAQRKSIEEMTPAEMRRELLTDSLTGLGNRRALEETEAAYAKKGIEKIKAFIDVDSLKFVNDHLGGHEAGDKLLSVIGEALGKATKESYRLSGDEFCFLADTEEEAEAIANNALEWLQQVVIRYEAPDGSVYEYSNPGFSYGIAKDLATADKRMLENKKERTSAGLRAERAQPPPGLAQVAPPGRKDNDRKPGSQEGYGPPSVKEYLATFAVKTEEAPEPPPEPSPVSSFQP